ncbi:MAG: DUF4405 domain-containing protein, partial [Oscillospiraceae bacterium]
GAELHECIGAGVFLLFILHHILNYKWLTSFFKGKYTATRFLNTAVNILVFICMLGLMYSGIVMSQYVFAFLPINGGAALARKIHMFCSYWGLVLMSLHLGLHWNVIMGIVRKITKAKKSSVRTVVLRLFAIFTAGYGAYAFVKRNVMDYLLLKIQFAFFDMSESLVGFILDYAAIMGSFAVVGYYVLTSLRKLTSKNKGDIDE